MPQALNSTSLTEYMQAHGIPGEILHLSAPTPTVETAAQAVGVQTAQIVKSILFLVGENPVLAITCGTAHVDRRAIASLYDVGRKQVKLASAEAVQQIAGYAVGAMPPFGHLRMISTLMDRMVLAQDKVYAGGGDENVLVCLSPRDIQRHTQALVIDLQDPPSQERSLQPGSPL